jgi:hypothetical protein
MPLSDATGWWCESFLAKRFPSLVRRVSGASGKTARRPQLLRLLPVKARSEGNHNQFAALSLSGVTQGEIVEAIPLVARDFPGGREEAQEHLAEVIGADAVEIVLALAARLDQARDAEQGQVMADGRLALAEAVAQVGDMKLAVGRQREVEQDAETGLVAQEFEDLGELTDRLIGHFRTQVGEVTVCRG